MGKIFHNVSEIVGRTPLMELHKIGRKYKLETRIFGKLEYLNPGGSVKDRIVREMIDQGIKEGFIDENTTIIEPTSGNTGIGLAALGASLDYKVILTMPETMSVERRNILKAYGAEIVLTPGSEGMKGALAKAEELAKEIPNSFIPSQFDNPANPEAHRKTTGPEIWEDLDGKVDILVAGVGTGGTITGAGGYLKERNPELEVYAIEPKDSPVLSQGQAGSHGIQGIGANFVPSILDTDIYNEVITVATDDAFATAKELGRTEGILCGISSGAALWAGLEIAKREENKGKNMVIVLPDSGDRYYSTALFQEEE